MVLLVKRKPFLFYTILRYSAARTKTMTRQAVKTCKSREAKEPVRRGNESPRHVPPSVQGPAVLLVRGSIPKNRFPQCIGC